MHACRVLTSVLTWLINPFVLGGTCMILSFALLIAHGQQSYQKRNLDKSRAEFEQYRLEVQAKVGPSITCMLPCSGTMQVYEITPA